MSTGITILKKLKLHTAILLAGLISFYSCTNNVYLDKITRYLNAPSTELKAKLMADNYRSYFMKNEGKGDDLCKYTNSTNFL